MFGTKIGSCVRAAGMLGIALIAIVPARAAADERYVDCVHGSDANDGLTPQTAWRSINYGIEQLGNGTLDIAEGVCPSEHGIHMARLPGIVALKGAGAGRTIIEDDLAFISQDVYPGWAVNLSGVSIGGSIQQTPTATEWFALQFADVRAGGDLNFRADLVDLNIENSRLKSLVTHALKSTTVTIARSEIAGETSLGYAAETPAAIDLHDSRFGGPLAIAGTPSSTGRLLRNHVPRGAVLDGVCTAGSSPFVIAANLFGGTGLELRGSAAGSDGPCVVVGQNTIVGDGLTIDGPSFRVVGNIVSGRLSLTTIPALDLGVSGNGFSPRTIYCKDGDCSGDIGRAGEGNVVAHPRFVNARRGNFHLRPDSPFVDFLEAAAHDDVPAETVATDLDGRARPIDVLHRGDGRTLDAGAFEYAPPAVKIIGRR